MTNLIDPDLFVPSREEADYCARHKITLIRLKNGTRIIAVPRDVSDLANLTTTFTFKSGAYFDPAGMSGLHHLVEHLMDTAPNDLAYLNDANSNAATAADNLSLYVWGIAHPAVLDYGVWPVLPTVFESFSSPFAAGADKEKILEKEKDVVRHEIHKKQNSHEAQAVKILAEILYDPKNPLNVDIAGSIPDINAIKVTDVENLVNKKLTPDKLIATIFSEGDSKIAKTAIEIITDLITNMPKRPKTASQIDYSLYDYINKDFQQGKTYVRNSGVKNNTVHVRFIWNFNDLTKFSREDAAMNRFFSELTRKFVLFVRSSGLAYTQFGQIEGGYKNVFLTLGMDVASRADLGTDISKNILSLMKDNLYRALNDQEITRIVEKGEKNRRAVPMLAARLLEYSEKGLMMGERILDAEKIWERFRSIDRAEMKDWRERIMGIDPTIVIIGDLPS